MLFFFFFNDTATTEIYTLSLHDALPICLSASGSRILKLSPEPMPRPPDTTTRAEVSSGRSDLVRRSEEHTSELQSQSNLVCRLLLEKKKKQKAEITLHQDPHTHSRTEHS